ncbi:886b8a94-fa89-48b4-85aa-8d300128a200 [Thermothielavioides terrestris]|uniref:886b8a94-fa89-48b4-85aa-8d300128a200 n=1 Tax=Thermothielavioides terrestris TaxID=2587410 RepID=A0A3S4BJ18_9PEZI|nr:886b8a94-fa89-48b4-85aa-8d300128a200 [Thermothielavioides terrestris]
MESHRRNRTLEAGDPEASSGRAAPGALVWYDGLRYSVAASTAVAAAAMCAALLANATRLWSRK